MAQSKQETQTKQRKIKRQGTSSDVVRLESAGSFCEGILQDVQVKDLYSPRTRTTNPTRIYKFRTEDGKGFVVTGRAMLDDQFDEISIAESGHGIEDKEGLERLRGEFFRIERMEDKKTGTNNPLGVYVVSMFE